MQNFIKTIINAVQSWTKKEIKDSTADWNQNDTSAVDYVKNRTHWEEEDGTVHKLDSKYLKLPTNLATTDDVQEVMDVANTAQTTANTKMDAVNPVGTGSFSMNRQTDMPIGDYSFAVGNNTIAIGESQSIFGRYNQYGYEEITEPFKILYGGNLGRCSSSYTFDKATGMFTLCEPTNVKYLKNCVAGEYWISGSNVTGNKMYNLTSTYLESIMHTSRILGGALIIGNGTSDTARSNAHTIDWNGVGWFQGGLQVGGNAQDDGAKNVLLEGDAIPTPTTAQVGQLLSVKAVDENGKPTEWEVVDMPSGSATSTNGFELVDRTTGAYYNVYIDNGQLTMEVV